jgi:cation transport ATPase
LRTIEKTRAQFDRCQLIGEDGAAAEVAVTEVQVGQRVRVPAGAAISVDGVVAALKGWRGAPQSNGGSD